MSEEAERTDRFDAADEREIEESLRRDGYSPAVIDHWLHPRNFGRMTSHDGSSGVYTGPCGDSMAIWLKVNGKTISRARFISDICIGAVASGSMITELAVDRSVTEAMWLTSSDILEALGGLPDEYAHCALLAEKTLQEALKDHNALKATPWKRIYSRQG